MGRTRFEIYCPQMVLEWMHGLEKKLSARKPLVKFVVRSDPEPDCLLSFAQAQVLAPAPSGLLARFHTYL